MKHLHRAAGKFSANRLNLSLHYRRAVFVLWYLLKLQMAESTNPSGSAQQDTAANLGSRLTSCTVPGKEFGEDLIKHVKQLVCSPSLPTLSSAHVCSHMEFAALTCRQGKKLLNSDHI